MCNRESTMILWLFPVMNLNHVTTFVDPFFFSFVFAGLMDV